MLPKIRLRPRNELGHRDSQPSPSSSRIKEATTVEDDQHKATESVTPTQPREASESGCPKPIKIDGGDKIYSVAFFDDGRHVVSGGKEGKIRRWRVADGTEAGTPMNTGSPIFNLAVSRDGRWIVSGTQSGTVAAWNAKSHEKLTEFNGHGSWVRAVDISPDGTRVATGSNDWTACVWALDTGERLLGPFRHYHDVAAVMFSPDGRLLATATCGRDSVRIYDGHDGPLVVDVPLQVYSPVNQTLAWADDGGQLFVLSHDGNINCLDVSTGATLSRWSIHSSNEPMCLALASNGTVIAATASSSTSFWDTATHEQIVPVVRYPHFIATMAMSKNFDIATAGSHQITLRSLCDILPSPYRDNMLREREIHCISVEKTDLEDTVWSLRAQDARSVERIAHLEKQLADAQHAARQVADLNESIYSLRAERRAQDECSSSEIAHLNETVRELRSQLDNSKRTAKKKEDSLLDIIKSLRADLRARAEGSGSELARLDKTVRELRGELAASQHAADQQKINLNETIELLRTELYMRETNSAHLEETAQELRNQLAMSRRTANEREDSLNRIIRAHERKHHCEVLFGHGHIYGAAKSLLEIKNSINDDQPDNRFIVNWTAEFADRCVARLQMIGEEASHAEKHDEALAAYSTALSLTSSAPKTVLAMWTRTMLIRRSANETCSAASKLGLPRFQVYRAICDVYEGDGRIAQAMQCFRQIQNEDMNAHHERAQWELDFRERCVKKLEKSGDAAMDIENHDDAIDHYSNALSFDPVNAIDILVKRSKARAAAGLWDWALDDAIKIIELDPSSYRGYERRHAALHGTRHHTEAFVAFEMMLSKLKQSNEPDAGELRQRYIDATPLIQGVIEQTIRDMPRVLIDITTGHLCDKIQQAVAFEDLPIYGELRSSMITRNQLDYPRIQREVSMFYRYVMLSHKWQPNEPTFQMVENVPVYRLPASPTTTKLLGFCDLVRALSFRWAWSDTCCVNQADKGVQQESIVAMFRWYRGSSLTIVHLLGVLSESQEFGCLWKSIWNTRGWTYQEYVASEAVQFYTEDWKPYLGLDVFNHKESPLILTEMERVMNVAPQELAALRPGLNRVREKLYLASGRQTTREEDMAYSLFGIFDVALPVIYGEGKQAVRRLLEHILTRSDNVTLLSWIGNSGSSYCSYLPADLSVYDQIGPVHVPPPMEAAEMDREVAALRASLPSLSQTLALYEQLHHLPPLSVVAGRLRLAGIVFPLSDVVRLSEPASGGDLGVYGATSPMLGDVRIETADDLVGMASGLVLLHPWVGPLLDCDFAQGTPRCDRATRAVRLMVRLGRPFGALVLASLGRVQYRRVATERVVEVRVREGVGAEEWMEGVRTVDVQ